MSRLSAANLTVLVLLLAHTADHGLNQPDRVMPGSTTLVGVGGVALIAASALLAARRSALAAQASAFAGAATLAGLVAVHLAPRWWDWVSDPYWDFGANALSWVSLISLVVASAWLMAAGVRRLPSAA